eukprot:892011-Amphidinium_carterae.1
MATRTTHGPYSEGYLSLHKWLPVLAALARAGWAIVAVAVDDAGAMQFLWARTKSFVCPSQTSISGAVRTLYMARQLHLRHRSCTRTAWVSLGFQTPPKDLLGA